jgi:hypothetical protein
MFIGFISAPFVEGPVEPVELCFFRIIQKKNYYWIFFNGVASSANLIEYVQQFHTSILKKIPLYFVCFFYSYLSILHVFEFYLMGSDEDYW